MIDIAPEDQARIVTVIGRGHSATREAARWLMRSGVHIGDHRNGSEDIRPGTRIYRAANIMGRRVRFLGAMRWDLSDVLEGEVDSRWRGLWTDFLRDLISEAPKDGLIGWKLPETLLSWPWLARELPHARYLLWTRDPRGSILKEHGTDDLSAWDVDAPSTGTYQSRCLSWAYQYQLITDVPRPERCVHVRLSDYGTDPDGAHAKLVALIGDRAARPDPKMGPINRWRNDDSWRAGGQHLQVCVSRYEAG